ncbi:hypothetical protein [Rubrivivax albus]|uniref:Uncharacterized protein n=1 Tax=Rubrivivax albus TaxID=2499835 RepID=A0A3S2TRE8_9BURK|nr:hypothetical protein [Rubrivivax albus]RVT52159.1 hypothetical protein ENE75_06775 [Rubrivivax albus]
MSTGRMRVRRGVRGLARWLTLGGLSLAGAVQAQTYAIDYIASVASGVAMDRLGRVVVGSTSLPPPCVGCPPIFNVPAIWVEGRRQLLTVPEGAAYLSFSGVNASGWIAGTAMRLDATGGAGHVWVPRADGSGHDATPIGQLAGFADAIPAGIDDSNRVIGLARTWFVAQDPFTWTAAEGIQSLTAMGYPADEPVAVSPGGTVATRTLTYRFGEPGSATAAAPPPAGFYGNTSTLTGAVNDDGMRASFLLSTSGTSQGYRYLARYSDAGGWQVLAGPAASSVPYGVGGVQSSGTITGHILSSGLISFGPDGPAQSLTSFVSAAYPEAGVGAPGEMADDGSILAQVLIGRSHRLAKLVPVQPCAENCLRVSAIAMKGRMVSEPGQPPGQCTPGARNEVSARITVVGGDGLPVAGATLRGRFLDDYYLDQVVTLRTNRKGQALARHSGEACVGAVAFLVDGVTKTGLALDRTTGQLSAYTIAQPRR